jgi:hypothetical protein
MTVFSEGKIKIYVSNCQFDIMSRQNGNMSHGFRDYENGKEKLTVKGLFKGDMYLVFKVRDPGEA